VKFADRLEKATDFMAEVSAIVKETIKDHKRVIFNGNNYSPEWVEEATKRGLPNIANAVDCVEVLKAQKNIDVFKRQGVLTEVEIHSRYEINLEIYSKIINIEALTMLDISNRQLIPATLEFVGELAPIASTLKSASDLLAKIASLADGLSAKTADLKVAVDAASAIECPKGNAQAYRDSVLPAMEALRAVADELEPIMPAKIWPLPTYADLLFRV
jgi:glutamine synthetase